MSSSKRLNAAQAALVFGRSLKGDKWYLAALVAMYVKPSKGGRPKKLTAEQAKAAEANGGGKISAVAFAKIAGVDGKTVLRYLAAWNKAAEDKIVQHADTLTPFSDDDGEILQNLIETQGGVSKSIEGVPAFGDYLKKVTPPKAEPTPATDAEADTEVKQAAQEQDEKAAVVEAEQATKEAADKAEEEAHKAKLADVAEVEDADDDSDDEDGEQLDPYYGPTNDELDAMIADIAAIPESASERLAKLDELVIAVDAARDRIRAKLPDGNGLPPELDAVLTDAEAELHAA